MTRGRAAPRPSLAAPVRSACASSPGGFTTFTRPIVAKEAVDPYTVRLHTAQPYAMVPYDLVSVFIVSKHVAQNARSQDFDNGTAMIGTGPYRFVRHPIYSGLLLAFMGTAVMIGEWRALIAFTIIFGSFLYKFRVEERLLRMHFGDSYVQYAARTKALIPGIS